MGQQLGRYALGERSQDTGDICDEFVIGEFELSIFAVMVVLFEDVFLGPI